MSHQRLAGAGIDGFAGASRPLTAACIALVLGVSAGCIRHAAADGDDWHTDGRWVGQPRGVTVYDAAGREHRAAALQIQYGPRPPYDAPNIPEEAGAGRLPLLVRGSETIRPNELRPGRFVEVKGRMTVSEGVHVGDAAVTRRPAPRLEHVIQLDSRPEGSDRVIVTSGGLEWQLGPPARKQKEASTRGPVTEQTGRKGNRAGSGTGAGRGIAP